MQTKDEAKRAVIAFLGSIYHERSYEDANEFAIYYLRTYEEFRYNLEESFTIVLSTQWPDNFFRDIMREHGNFYVTSDERARKYLTEIHTWVVKRLQQTLFEDDLQFRGEFLDAQAELLIPKEEEDDEAQSEEQ